MAQSGCVVHEIRWGTPILTFPLEGEGRGERLRCGLKDLYHHPNCILHQVRICQNLIVPESNDSETFPFQPGSARGLIAFQFRVLPAVYFYDEFILKAYEVNNVGSYRDLSTKFAT